MNTKELHEWIGEWNRFDIVQHKHSVCFWPGGSCADLWPFTIKDTDYTTFWRLLGRNYNFETDSYTYDKVQSIDKTSEDSICVHTIEKWEQFDGDCTPLRQTTDLKSDIFIIKYLWKPIDTPPLYSLNEENTSGQENTTTA